MMNTPIGYLDILYDDILPQLTSVKFTENSIESIGKELNRLDSSHNNYITKQLSEYFKGSRTKFDFNIETIDQLKGTFFQKKVWKAIYNIPYGNTKTYSDIAIEIGSPNAYRAVANACSGNPIAIIIPCHRVIGKKNIGGYKWGQYRKEWLLDFEKIKR